MMEKKLDFDTRLYGKGDAGEKVVSILCEYLKGITH